jgi:hypothetical protein
MEEVDSPSPWATATQNRRRQSVKWALPRWALAITWTETVLEPIDYVVF